MAEESSSPIADCGSKECQCRVKVLSCAANLLHSVEKKCATASLPASLQSPSHPPAHPLTRPPTHPPAHPPAHPPTHPPNPPTCIMVQAVLPSGDTATFSRPLLLRRIMNESGRIALTGYPLKEPK